VLARLFAVALVAASPNAVPAPPDPIGVVIMHGKGGAPTRLVSDLASALEGRGYLVANLEMPWSGRRNYDVPVERAEEQVHAAVADLRSKGAERVFVAGHSLGGLFAVHLAGRLALDGVIAIAPGGSVNSPVYREKLGGSVARARQLVADGKGGELARLDDFEGSKGIYPVVTQPLNYLIWFDPEGVISMVRALRAVKPQVPVLWIIPKRDYPLLRKANVPMFATLPSNSMSRLYEPDSDHLGAPAASAAEIMRWTREVGEAPKR
jgi:pimeloyl-ACP methyl ester carboxylesterase